MADILPFNIYISKWTKKALSIYPAVTVTDMFVGATQELHPEGLYSEEIFGQVGTEERDYKMARIDLGVEILHPFVYRSLKKIKKLYIEIIQGQKYAKWDDAEKTFVPSNSIDGRTGYAFFMEYFDKLELRRTKSFKNQTIIKVFEDYKDNLTIDSLLILPAGLRDVVIKKDGSITTDEINKELTKLISLSTTTRLMSGSNKDLKILDVPRRSMQNAMQNIYEYIKTLITGRSGKTGYAPAKWAGRAIAYSSRNVVSAMDTSLNVLDDENNPTINSVIFGLFQTCKMFEPLAINSLRNGFLSKRFTTGDEVATLVDRKTFKEVQVHIDDTIKDEWTSIDGLHNFIESFREERTRNNPIIINGHYLGLVYLDDVKFQLLYSIDELPAGWDKNKVIPLTPSMLLYTSCYNKIKNRYTTNTRAPVTGTGSIYISDVYINTTSNSKQLNEYVDGKPTGRVYPRIPDQSPNAQFFDAASPHTSRLARAGADFDGDMFSFSSIMSLESEYEIQAFMKTTEAVVSPSGEFINSVKTDIVERVLYNLTGDYIERNNRTIK